MIKTKWDLKQLFPDGNIEEYTKTKVKKWKAFATKYRKDKSFLKSPKKLKEALDEYCLLDIKYGTYGKDTYLYSLKSSLDLENSSVKKKHKELSDILVGISNDLEFFTLELGKVDKEKQAEVLNSTLLFEYKYYLQRLFTVSRYFLSEDSEKLFSLINNSSFKNWVKMTNELVNTEEITVHDSSGKDRKISFSELTHRFRNPEKRIRKEASERFNEVLNKYIKISEFELNSILDYKKVSDDLRGYKYPEEANHIGNDISTTVIDGLVTEVTKANNIPHRYYKLKSQLMGMKKLKYYDRNVSLGSISKKYPFLDALKIVRKSFEKIDEDFSRILLSYFNNGKVDVYPKVGKRDGASCSWVSKTIPSFILLNNTGTFEDVTTIAHEFGHAINAELMRDVKNPLYYGISSINLEVPSNFFQDFVCDEIAESLSREDQLSLLMERLNSAVSSVHRQIACYKFEGDLHREFRKKKFLSYEEIGKLFSKRMKEYMGDFVDHPKYSHNWWVYWSHIRKFFYVYSYASGDLISRYMQRQVRKDKKWIENFKKFLRAGSSDSPTNILKSIGIDIESGEIWKEGLDEIDEMLKKAEKLAKDLGKI
jgi:oligoendopeptidase F